ncbi:MAG TPA: FHA domain-containing protein [Oligoflexia bacterium]|nr:FHA domain-containing protein [Oligoflexia bacterium]HMP26368.1 FHA domain-containing protein [Oligoflexia bacterium]
MSFELIIRSLEFTSGFESGSKTFEKDELLIGSAAHCDLQLEGEEISSEHLKIRGQGDSENNAKIFIKDLGSQTGSKIENFPLASKVEVEIQKNQRLFIGSYVIKVKYIPSVKPAVITPVDTTSSNPPPPTPADQLATSISSPPTSSVFTLREEVKDPELHVVSKKDKKSGTDDDFIKPVAGMSISSLLNKAKEPSENEATSNKIDQQLTDSKASEKVSSSKSTQSVAVTVDSSFSAYMGKAEDSDIPTLDFEAIQLFNLSGKVTHKNTPLAGVEITGGALGKINSDSSGKFIFKDIEDGTQFEIKASKERYIFKTPSFSGVLSTNKEFAFEAIRLYSINGKVRHRGQPLADVEIDGGALGKTRTDSDGKFSFDGIKEDTQFEIKASKNKFIFTSSNSKGTLTSESIIDFNAIKLITISGIISHKGKALGDVEVNGGPLGITRTDNNGRYSFVDIPENTEYTITAKKDGFKFTLASSSKAQEAKKA